MPSSPPKTRLRIITMALIALGLNLGPFYTQVLKGSPYIGPTWRMFSGKGVGLIAARYYYGQAGPRAGLIDHRELRVGRRPKAPKHIKDLKTLAMVTEAVCKEAGENKGDVRLVAKEATRQGWKSLEDGGRAICVEGHTQGDRP